MTQQYLSEIPQFIACINDYIPFAKKNLSHEAWEYIHSGSADDISAERNLKVYQDILLTSQVLTDVTEGNTRTTILGQDLSHPIILAPVAYQKLAHPDGEIASAMAAEAQEAMFVLSSLSSINMEEVAQSTQGPKWFQLYFQDQKASTLQLIQRAERAGYSALMVTVDAPINGLRNRLQRIGFQLPAEITAANLRGVNSHLQPEIASNESHIFQGLMASAPSWKDIQWLKDNTTLPIIIKGIMSQGDAALALENGVDAIVISNHGGRTLDTLPSPIEVLPSISQALEGKLPIIIDSGIRRGGDVFKALALGADAVMLGRPIMYALAVAGALGVAHSLKILKDELELTMALCGCANIKDINKSRIWKN